MNRTKCQLPFLVSEPQVSRERSERKRKKKRKAERRKEAKQETKKKERKKVRRKERKKNQKNSKIKIKSSKGQNSVKLKSTRQKDRQSDHKENKIALYCFCQSNKPCIPIILFWSVKVTSPSLISEMGTDN